ncbi:MAG: flagellar basal body protein FliL [Spirochaetaceae bacterium]|jgi:flagellar basal body-associated protein FliL|nr:flagellar basal body protein FliL [Spirochaetaceae bacterium]
MEHDARLRTNLARREAARRGAAPSPPAAAENVPERSAKKTPSRVLVVIWRALLGLALFLALVLAAGSLYGLLRPPVPPAAETENGERVFTETGQVRAVTSGPEAATVIVSIAFPYPASDREFSGELSARAGDFRTAAAAYFGSLSAARLRETPEDAVKTELLARFNALLRLGQIEKLYFSDYLILE